MTVIADTGALVALIDPDTREHQWAREQVRLCQGHSSRVNQC